MTETQNASRTDHRAPLAPGEVRTHTVGAEIFQVAHVMNGDMTRVIYSIDSQPVVICGTTWERIAVRAYADAVERAEAQATHAEARVENVIRQRSTTYAGYDDEAFELMVRRMQSTFGLVVDFELGDVDLSYNTPMGADMGLVTGEPTLAELLDAYQKQTARAAYALAGVARTSVPNVAAAVPHAERADALKAEILKRFGGAE